MPTLTIQKNIASRDSYVRGGSYGNINFGYKGVLEVKNDNNNNNNDNSKINRLV